MTEKQAITHAKTRARKTGREFHVLYVGDDLREWLAGGGFLPEMNEPALSALLIMSRQYAEAQTDEVTK